MSAARGDCYVISAPSGAGKTSLVRALVESLDRITVSTSHTTRPQRDGEVEGRDYHFVDLSGFEQMIDRGEFLEHARVFGNYYGTSIRALETPLAAGTDVVLEIDWQGARRIRELFPDCVSVFIVPPSVEELRQRLVARGRDDPATIELRMREAALEMSHYGEYDYLVVNDLFELALQDLQAVVRARRLRTAAQRLRRGAELDRLVAP
jgi:guanylate kinase